MCSKPHEHMKKTEQVESRAHEHGLYITWDAWVPIMVHGPSSDSTVVSACYDGIKMLVLNSVDPPDIKMTGV